MERFADLSLDTMMAVVAILGVLCLLLNVKRMMWLAERRLRLQAIGEVAELVGAADAPCYRTIDALVERYPSSILSEALSEVAEHICGIRLYRVAMIAERSGIYEYLQRKAACNTSLQRARYLALLAKFPLSRRYGDYVAMYLDDSDSRVRFYAFVVQLVADSEAAVRRLAAFDRMLAPFELATLLYLLRRGDSPIAYTPLLCSESCNLRMLGMMVASHFGDAECESLLHKIVGRDDDTSVEALYALASIRGSVAHDDVRHLVNRLSAPRRRSLCRRLAHEGYSCKAIESLLDTHEQQYFEELSNSYKRPILCS